jgi:hypothetical protein
MKETDRGFEGDMAGWRLLGELMDVVVHDGGV